MGWRRLGLVGLLATHAAALSTPQSLLVGLGRVAEAHPFVFGSSLTCIKTVCSDVVVQTQVEKRASPDLRRAGIFALYGFLYLGAVQYGLWSRVYPSLFPRVEAFAALPVRAKLADRRGAVQLAGQILVDQGLHWPLSAIPAFYFCKMVGETGRARSLDFLRAYRANWRSDVATCWAIWVPAEAITFGTLPIAYQVPFAALVSFGYTALVSFRRGAAAAPTAAAAE